MTRAEIADRFDAIVGFSEIGRFLDQVLHGGPFIARHVGLRRLEYGDQKITHADRTLCLRISADRFALRHIRLPHCDGHCCDDREHESHAGQHAALVASDELARAIPG